MSDGSERDVAAAPEFRVGPNPGAVAAEVAALRAMPVVLAPTSTVGTLPGAASVDPNGAAHYTIPIEVTPGPRGMAPELALTYDSNAEGGAFGHRFDLAGLSAITRCPRNPADDGVYTPVHYTVDDALCIDGQRLVLAAGAAGEAGSEYRTAEGPFARIEVGDGVQAFGGTFTVSTSDGRVLTYGTAAASLWIGASNGTRIPWRWAIQRACDRWDNCIEYEYEHGVDSGNGPAQLRLTSVRYGGTGDPASRRAVAFTWIARDDARHAYRFGASVSSERVVSRIEVLGPQAGLVRSYRFDYSTHALTGSTRLASAKVCDAVGVCLPPTTFDWTEDAADSLGLREWEGVGLPATQAALLRTRHAAVGDFVGYGTDDVLFATVDANEPWLLWGYESNYGPAYLDEQPDPQVLLPLSESVLPPPITPGAVPGEDIYATYLDYMADASPEFTISTVDFNGDAVDDVLIPVRAGWPSLEASRDDAGIPYAEQFLIAAPDGSGHFSTIYIDDGSDQAIYSIVPLDNNGDGLTDVWMCRGDDAHLASWVFGRSRLTGGSYGFDFFPTTLGCSPFDELSISSVDGGPANLLVIRAFDDDGDVIESEARGGYERLTFDQVSGTASLVGSGLPRDRYQREHDKWCANGGAMEAGIGPVATAGIGLDRHFDLNADGFPDLLRFELASGDDPQNDDIRSGMLTDAWSIEQRLADSSDWRTVSLCGDGANLEHDAVLAVYWNTGAGYVRGANALDLYGNAHAQLWLGFAGAVNADVADDGRMDLLMPSTGPGTSWTSVDTDAGGQFRVAEFSAGLDGWPAYVDDDTWESELLRSTQTRVLMVGRGATDRPALWFIGQIDDSPDFPYWVNEYRFASNGPDGQGANRVEMITDGVGAETRFEYKAEWAPKLPEAEWPKAPMRQALWVTTAKEESITQTDATPLEIFVAGRRRTDYRYFDGVWDRGGRGFLGFGRVLVDEWPATPTPTPTQSTLTIYDQTYDPVLRDYPAAGRPAERRRYTAVADGRVQIERSLWTWTTRHLPLAGGITHFSYPAVHREMDLEVPQGLCEPLSGCSAFDSSGYHSDVTTTEVRDDFNVLVTSVEQASEGSDVVTQVDQTDIVHDTERWLIGQVGRITVQSCGAGLCEARVTEQEFDSITGVVTELIIQPGDPMLALSTSYQHDPHGNVELVTQIGADGTPMGSTRTTGTQWDDEGVFPLAKGNALGQVSYLVHDRRSGALVAEVDPAGLTVKRRYDGLYRLVGEARHVSPIGVDDGAPTSVEYLGADVSVSGSALRVRTTTTNGQQGTEYVSAAGDILERRWKGMAPVVGNPDAIAAGADVFERFGYDAYGRQVARSVPQWVGIAPAGWHRRSLDGLGRPMTRTAPDGVVLETIEYRSFGVDNFSAVERRSSQGASTLVRTTWHDGRGRPIRETDAEGVATCFEHGPFDLMVRVERNCAGPGTRLVSSTDYDALGHPVAQEDPHLGVRGSAYNGFGELVSSRDGEGRVTSYFYDPLGRIMKRNDADGNATFTYDVERLGALDSDTSPDGVVRTYDLDAFGRTSRMVTTVATTSGTDDYRFEWLYGPGGRLDAVTYPIPDGEPAFGVRYVYDAVGNLRIAKDQSTGAARWRLLTANASGMPLSEGYGDGTGTNRVYDLDRLWTDHIIHTQPSGTLAQLSYTWTPEGELERRQDVTHGQSERFEYDRQWRLTKATIDGAPAASRTFTYDVFGNITSATGVGAYAYDANARLTSIAGAAVTHDLAGNMLTHGTRVTTYTPFGKVRRVAVGSASLTMKYAADGSRVSRRQSSNQEDLVTLDKHFERRIDKHGVTQASTWRVVAGDRVVAQVARTRNAFGAFTTSEQYLHDDNLGSTVLVTATGALGPTVVVRASNDAWGRARSATDWKTWTADTQAGLVGIGFTGHRAELDHGLIDAGGRMYDPKIGRFTSPDPLVIEPFAGASYNRYAYVGNRPLRFTDPSGWAASDGHGDGPGFGTEDGQAEEFFDRLTGEMDARIGSVMGNAFYDVAQFAESELSSGLSASDLLPWNVAASAARRAQSTLGELVDFAVLVATNPAEAAALFGEQVLHDAGTVLSTYGAVSDAIDAGDYARAVELWVDGAKAAFNIAALVVGGAGSAAKLQALATKAARRGMAVGRAAPPPNSGQSPPHGSAVHDARLRKIAKKMEKNGWQDIRVNQVQVDAKGNIVGNNRPDVQGINPRTGQRVTIEVDTTAPGSARHQKTVPANDPSSVHTFIQIDATGRPVAATTVR